MLTHNFNFFLCSSWCSKISSIIFFVFRELTLAIPLATSYLVQLVTNAFMFFFVLRMFWFPFHFFSSLHFWRMFSLDIRFQAGSSLNNWKILCLFFLASIVWGEILCCSNSFSPIGKMSFLLLLSRYFPLSSVSEIWLDVLSRISLCLSCLGFTQFLESVLCVLGNVQPLFLQILFQPHLFSFLLGLWWHDVRLYVITSWVLETLLVLFLSLFFLCCPGWVIAILSQVNWLFSFLSILLEPFSIFI